VIDGYEKGLDCYDPEGRVFPRLAKKTKERQGLSAEDVLLILKWKLGRIKNDNSKTVAVSKMNEINQAINAAYGGDRKGKIAALTALEKIPGIRLATATAILTVCYPDEFTIIDQRVLEILGIFPSRLVKDEQKNKYSTNNWTPEDYVDEYLPRVKKHSKSWGCTLRNADRALWGLSVNKRIKEVIYEELSEQKSLKNGSKTMNGKQFDNQSLENRKRELADEYIKDAHQKQIFLTKATQYKMWANYIAGLILDNKNFKEFHVGDIRRVLKRLLGQMYDGPGAKESGLLTASMADTSNWNLGYPCLQKVDGRRGYYRFIGFP
jgi:hypothetical protein